MNGQIPQRIYYSVPEAAELLGVSPEYLYDLIRKGRMSNPPANAISPDLIRTFGNKLTIHRSYLFPAEKRTITPLIPRLTDDEKAAIADAAIERFIARLFELAKGRAA